MTLRIVRLIIPARGGPSAPGAWSRASPNLAALELVQCRRIFADKESGKNDARPELKTCHAFPQSGDTLVVPVLDRYGRSLQDLITMAAELRRREIGFPPRRAAVHHHSRRASGLPRFRRPGRPHQSRSPPHY